MNCPACNVLFWATQRQGVQIHYCPRCLGVWINGGGLETIVEGASMPARGCEVVPAEDPEKRPVRCYASRVRQRKPFFRSLFD
jgi:Zn-finger nucleic acid-binding protein